MSPELGRDFFFLIATDNPVSLDLRQQCGTTTSADSTRRIQAVGRPLEDLLAGPRSGVRERQIRAQVKDWSTALVSVLTRN